ncbi:hypothetical protein I4200191B4_00310 [Pseudoflavonifractor gallinarum]
MTFSPVWDTIEGHDRYDGASTADTAGQRGAPLGCKRATARNTGDGLTSGPGDGRGPLPAPVKARGRRFLSPLNMGGTTEADAFVP